MSLHDTNTAHSIAEIPATSRKGEEYINKSEIAFSGTMMVDLMFGCRPEAFIFRESRVQ
jgi:hypothetical protein